MTRTPSMKALAALALLAGPLLAYGQERLPAPQEQDVKVAAAQSLAQETTAAPTAFADAATVGNSMDDSGVFSERPAPGVGVNDADINTAGEADSTDRR